MNVSTLEVADVGSRIRLVRLRQKQSQKWLARRLGVCQQTLSKIELGDLDPTVGTVLKAASALGTAPAFFFSEVTS